MRSQPVGILDSGVGGLSVLREVRAHLPAERLIFAADQAHVPYGPRSIDEVRAFTVGVTRFLIAQGVKLVIVACNTASAAALYHLRGTFPAMPFVGMEPAVKPAARATQTGVIGVIATETTFQGELFASVVGRFAQDVRVVTRACPEFVLLAESGDTHSPAAFDTVRRALAPLLDAGIDQLVLGCTHFPFLREAIQAAVGPDVTIVDPGPAVAQQAGRVLAARDLIKPSGEPGDVLYATSGDPGAFRRVMGSLLGADFAASAEVRGLRWAGDRLGFAEQA
ncbi:MAG: glutamate racemase [Anaerolineae bacterium]|nr:glutamate racemase [Anaerolineae bacterium]